MTTQNDTVSVVPYLGDEVRERLIEGDPIAVVDELLELRELKSRVKNLTAYLELELDISKDILEDPDEDMTAEDQKHLTIMMGETRRTVGVLKSILSGRDA